MEMERVKKWLKMLHSWTSSGTQDKLRKRVFKGVPDKLRGQVWSRMLNLATVRKEQSGRYQVRHLLVILRSNGLKLVQFKLRLSLAGKVWCKLLVSISREK